MSGGKIEGSVYLEREMEQEKKRRRKAGHTPLLIGIVRQGNV